MAIAPSASRATASAVRALSAVPNVVARSCKKSPQAEAKRERPYSNDVIVRHPLAPRFEPEYNWPRPMTERYSACWGGIHASFTGNYFDHVARRACRVAGGVGAG